MTNQEAKFILSAYRPGGDDAADPLFAEALRQARQDPALAEWLAREQALSETLAAKLGEVMPPPALRQSILTGVRVSAAQARPRRNQPLWIGIAASVALMVGGAAFWPSLARADMRKLAAFAADDAMLPQHGSHGPAASALYRTLLQPGTCLTTGVTVDFDALRTTGCRTLRFADHDIVELCFNREGVEFHFYAVRCVDFPNIPTGKGLSTGEFKGLGYVSWTHGDQQFLVVSRAGIDAIKKVL